MGSIMAESHLIWSCHDRPKSRLLRFRSLISRKGAELGYMLPLNTNRRPYGQYNGTVEFDPE